MEKRSIVKEKAFTLAKRVVRLSNFLKDHKEFEISRQLLRSGTSIGANITEALAGPSKRDFSFKMSLASKESRETYYWLTLLHETQIVAYNYQEEMDLCRELIKMLTAIVKTSRRRDFNKPNNPPPN